MLVPPLLGRGDGDELDLGELVLADHAAGILARRAGFGAKARRERGEAQRQRVLVEDQFAHEIGQRHFGGGDEPEVLFERRPFKRSINQSLQINFSLPKIFPIRFNSVIKCVMQ